MDYPSYDNTKLKDNESRLMKEMPHVWLDYLKILRAAPFFLLEKLDQRKS